MSAGLPSRWGHRLATPVFDHGPVNQARQSGVVHQVAQSLIRPFRILCEAPGDQLVIQLTKRQVIAFGFVFVQDRVDVLDRFRLSGLKFFSTNSSFMRPPRSPARSPAGGCPGRVGVESPASASRSGQSRGPADDDQPDPGGEGFASGMIGKGLDTGSC